MGSSELVSKDKQRVEYTSLTQLFEEQCPIYMSYGMSYDEYWFGEPYRTRFYRDAYKLKQKQIDERLWLQGMYIYEALCDVSPILHAFSSKGTKPLPYSQKPYMSQVEKTEVDKKQEEENQKLLAMLYFKKWARDTKKRFDKKK